MSCTIPANQPIHQALLDKAASYPVDKAYQARAYRAAAETVRAYEANIYEEFAKYNKFACCTPTIGKSTEQFIQDFIKAEPMKAAAKCTVPANEPIYKALQDKAASYPADKVYQARAYRKAAEKLRTHTTDLFSIEARTYELMDHLDQYWGPHVAEFIEKFIASQPSALLKPKCLWAPANEPIYKLLLEKAAEATAAGKTWSAKAWTTSAEKMSAATIDLVAKYGTDEYYKVLDNFGPKAWELIDDYCCAAPSLKAAEDAEKRRVGMMSAGGGDCFVPGNNGLYNALLYRASKASNKYSAKAYTDAATKVLSHPFSIPVAYNLSQSEIVEVLGGPSIVAYIKHYLNETQGGKVFKYPTTDDEKAEEALKLYCIKANYAYIPALLEEYKKWLPTASKWELERYDYDAQKYKPKSAAMIATIWAAIYSATLKPLNVANKYKQGVINYCKRNNIVYQPLMLERLDAWRETNKDKLVNTYPGCSCGSECDGGKVNTYPMGHVAVINKWFATLPKTVRL
jgi:DNA polymerase/3'-5' exonuclease PolX